MSETPENPDSPEAEGKQPATEGKGKSKKKLFVAIGALAILGGGGFFAWEKNYIPFLSAGKSTSVTGKKTEGMLSNHILLGIPSATANLDNGSGRTIYVKMTASIEVAGARDAASLQRYIPEIQDIFQTYLHETRPQDLRGNGFYRLKEALLRRLRVALSPLQVTNLYVKELLTQ